MSEYELRQIHPDESDAFLRAISEAFSSEMRDEELAHYRGTVETDRTLAAFAGGAIVATSELMSMRLAVPGAVVPMAGVSAVGVHAVHRGRGLLDRMIRGHLEAIRARGEEALAGLFASEAGIYGRWGFGVATRAAHLTIRSAEARLAVAAPETRPRAGHPQDLLDELRAVHAGALAGQPGMIARDDRLWKYALVDFEEDRDGTGRLRALVQDGSHGPEGYALFAVRKQRTADDLPDDVVELRELVAHTTAAAAALWEHLLGLSLSRTVRWPAAPEDEPLVHMLTDPRAVTARLDDALYLRLVDLPRALAQRTYAAPVDVVLEVEDAVCPWNAGRWRLAGDAGGATCEPTADAADLALGAREAGAAYLGGTTLAVLGAAGRVEERTAGALAAASHALGAVRAPWCFEDF
jgi:predicted acetyltransferase